MSVVRQRFLSVAGIFAPSTETLGECHGFILFPSGGSFIAETLKIVRVIHVGISLHLEGVEFITGIGKNAVGTARLKPENHIFPIKAQP